MALTSHMIPLGTPAPDFTLPLANGAGDVSLADVAQGQALLVAFICVHCPYVKVVEDAFAEFAREYAAKGLSIVAISSNDVEQYPDDAPEFMVEQAERLGFAFPYVYDADQTAAKAYGAACTPDLFLYDSNLKLAYRGQFDETRRHNGLVPDGADLRRAADLVLAGAPVPEPHIPSAGCGIKWKPGNEPKPAFSLL